MDAMPPPAPRSADTSKPRRAGASPLSSSSGPHRGSGLQWGVPPSIAEDGNAAAGVGGRHTAPSRAEGNDPPPVTVISSWEQYFDEVNQIEVPSRGCTFNVYKAGNEGPIIFCLHGGGYNGCSWALVAAALKDQCRVVAPDMRGHGLTQSADDLDLSKETLAEDAAALWEELFGGEGQGQCDTILLGHSLGGGMAVWAAALRRISALAGVVVIDVVEGTALASLVHMKTVLGNRPASFPSQEAAVEWALDSGISRSRKAASVSIPGQLVQDGGSGLWRWRTPLEKTRPFWEGWYRGLSEAFLALPMPKVLLLAGSDRLDRALTIGQMQGKFQLVVVPSAGHAVQEDESGRVVDVLRAFIKRFRISEPPSSGLPKPVPGLAPVLPVAAGPIHDGK